MSTTQPGNRKATALAISGARDACSPSPLSAATPVLLPHILSVWNIEFSQNKQYQRLQETFIAAELR